MKNKVLSMIGLASRAGKTQSGELAVSIAVRKKAFLVIVSKEASDATRSSYTKMCRHYKVPMLVYGTMDELGACCGKAFRAAVAITDSGFAKTVQNLIEKETVAAHTSCEP